MTVRGPHMYHRLAPNANDQMGGLRVFTVEVQYLV